MTAGWWGSVVGENTNSGAKGAGVFINNDVSQKKPAGVAGRLVINNFLRMS